MAERGCNFCSSDAKTQRARVTSLMGLSLCQRCAKVWDVATMAEETRVLAEADRAAAEARATKGPEETQLQTLFEAIRYLVRNTLPEELSDSGLQIRLIEELDAIVALGDRVT